MPATAMKREPRQPESDWDELLPNLSNREKRLLSLEVMDALRSDHPSVSIREVADAWAVTVSIRHDPNFDQQKKNWLRIREGLSDF